MNGSKYIFTVSTCNLKHMSGEDQVAWCTFPSTMTCDRPRRPPTLRVSPGNQVVLLARRSNPGGFGARFRYCKTKQKKIISMKLNINFNHFHQLLFPTFLLPLDQYNLFWRQIRSVCHVSYFENITILPVCLHVSPSHHSYFLKTNEG